MFKFKCQIFKRFGLKLYFKSKILEPLYSNLSMEEVKTRTQIIRMGDDGIVRCQAFKDSHHTLLDSIENIKAVAAVSNGKCSPVLVDIKEVKGIDRDARAYLASDEIAKHQSACALIIESSLSRLIGNFFLGLNKTKFPSKLFNEETSAIEWLKTFL
jgi:hypothetical protein